MRFGTVFAGLALAAFALTGQAIAAGLTATLPTGQAITPTAAPGSKFEPLNPDLPGRPDFLAGQASATALSPDGKTLLVMTTGYNRNNGPDGRQIADQSQEYVFVYDVTGASPVKRQVLMVPNTFLGIAWSPAGNQFYVSGGVDDLVVEFSGAPGRMARTRAFSLGHAAGLGNGVKPAAAGLAVSPDGRRLLVANVENDSVSLVDLTSGRVSDLDLRPGGGKAGGTFPRAVAWTDNATAYVASERDREIIRLNLGASPTVGKRIAVKGQPVALLAAGGGKLYAAVDNSDALVVIDTAHDRVLATVRTAGVSPSSAPLLGGAGSNALALSSDAQTIYVSNGAENAVAVVRLGGATPRVTGLIPTGWYPTGVAVSQDGKRLYVVNGKSPSGPNPGGCRNNTSSASNSDAACKSNNQYVWQLEKAGFLSLDTPDAKALAALTRQVDANNHTGPAGRAEDAAMMAFLHGKIHHVIYVLKENRTYDQILGDLGRGDGDPRLELFPNSIAPNHHRLALGFADLDAFRVSGESSNTGWDWSTAARTNDWTEREAPVNYASRGLQYDQEGSNRGLNVSLAAGAARHAESARTPDDPNILAGNADVAELDGPDEDEGHGYLWDAARRAHVSMRNWGFFGDLSHYSGAGAAPLDRQPAQTNRVVMFPTKAVLRPVTDLQFRAFDQAFPDYWRYQEWKREFDGFVSKGEAPGLMMVRLPHDHFGAFGTAIDGVNTVETQMADNDYAIGLLVEAVAHSKFASDTLIIITEDDAQDGGDHVDAHRSIALFVGPYVKQNVVVSTPYTTVDLLRTIEDILGMKPMNLNDARARPMTQVFDKSLASWTYTAVVPAALRATQLPLPPPTVAEGPRPATRSSEYWQRVMAGQDFSSEDRLDTVRFNAALWEGLKGADLAR